jgi:tetratricopeptide (TPR) repeat protein
MGNDIVIAAILLLGGLIGAAPAHPLASGDSAFVAIRYADARAIYLKALHDVPQSPATLWRLARLANVEAGSAMGEAKRAGYQEAERYARACVAADTTVAEGYTWLAVSLGNLAMFEGSKAKVRMCSEIKGALDRALLLKPDDDIAYTILGSFYRALGNVSWIERQLASVFLGSLPDGGYPEAEVALKKAIALAPGTLRHRKELGMLYIDWGKDEQAKTVLRESLQIPDVLASDAADKQRIREALADLD